jgi:hypothetical protein
MAHPLVKSKLDAFFQATLADAIAAGAATFRRLKNQETPDEPKTRAAREQVHVFLEFEAAPEDGAALGELGFQYREEEAIFYWHVIVGAGRGEVALDATLTAIKRALRRPDVDGVVLGKFIGGDVGERWGGAWIGVSTAVDYRFEFHTDD